jgi:hypothetical protein
MLTWEAIETGFETFMELLREDERVRLEFERSRAEFFSDATAVRTPGAELRHLEWFLLERPSAVLASTPAQGWLEEWRARLPGHESELSPAFLQSLPGAFEVTSVMPSEGLWVRDLFTLGEHPVAEARATYALAAGDLLVGRLYPSSGGVFLLSPSVSVFRNPELLAAVRIDLARMRNVRRGVLRVQQLELERLFHAPGSAPAFVPAPSEVRARARAQLVALGLERKDVEQLLKRVQRAARAANGREVTEILNALAFDTGIDLSSARLVLLELWDVERASSAPGPSAAAPVEVLEEAVDTSAALAAFDRGRAEGRDLEQLFQELERELGVAEVEGEDSEEEAEEDPGAPDFPGVVGAMVVEFLWEVEREQGQARASSWEILRELGNYGRDIGVFEDLNDTRLLDFSARWVLDESGLTRVSEVETLLEALTAFCFWCEQQQDLPLWKKFGPILERLRSSVPRHLLLRQTTTAGPGAGAYRVTSIGPGQARARDRAGEEQVFELSVLQAAHLREGDLVRLAREGARAVIGASYPAELGEAIF